MKTLKNLLLIALAASLMLAQVGGPVQWIPLADITGAGSTTQACPTACTGASAVQFVVPAANTGTARWGWSASVSNTFGGILPPGSGQFLPPQTPNYYQLSQLYVYVASGDKLTIVYAK